MECLIPQMGLLEMIKKSVQQEKLTRGENYFRITTETFFVLIVMLKAVLKTIPLQ
jgi:hypothetical protein